MQPAKKGPDPIKIKQRLHGLAALLLFIGGALYILTETVIPALLGLALSILAGIILYIAHRRPQ